MINLTGLRFGSLTVRKRVGSARGSVWWDCYCDCGKSIFASTGYLGNGNTRSCGCGQKKAAALTCLKRGKHFMKGTSLYNRWRSMLQRCYYKGHIGHKYYGGRGILVCEEWRKFEIFMQWALSNGYKESLSLDRINVDGNYEPANCRWITMRDQTNNRRCNVFISLDGRRQTVSQWATELNIFPSTLLNRLRSGWSPEQCLKTPISYRNRISNGTSPVSV